MKTLLAILIFTSIAFGQDVVHVPYYPVNADSLWKKVLADREASRKAVAYADSVCSKMEHTQTSIETLLEKWDKYSKEHGNDSMYVAYGYPIFFGIEQRPRYGEWTKKPLSFEGFMEWLKENK